MPEVLDKIFGSPARVRIMRLFLMNPGEALTSVLISKSAKIARQKVGRELNLLKSIGFIKKGIRETQIIVGRTKRIKRKRESGFQLNNLFSYNRGFRALLVESNSVSREVLIKKFRQLGRGLRFVALCGIFVGDNEFNAKGTDILVVGDNIRRSKLEKILGQVESEIGKEIKYALFDTKEFRYRRGMFDRFVLDILDNEHDVLMDSLGAEV